MTFYKISGSTSTQEFSDAQFNNPPSRGVVLRMIRSTGNIVISPNYSNAIFTKVGDNYLLTITPRVGEDVILTFEPVGFII